MGIFLEGSFPLWLWAPCLWQGLGGFGAVQGCAGLEFSQLCVGSLFSQEVCFPFG